MFCQKKIEQRADGVSALRKKCKEIELSGNVGVCLAGGRWGSVVEAIRICCSKTIIKTKG